MRSNTIYTLAISMMAVLISACGGRKAVMDDEHNTILAVTYTSDYCGGAYPDDEILEELMIPKPLEKETIYIFNNENVDEITSFQLNKEGKVSLNLKQGKYSVCMYNHVQVAQEMEELLSKGPGTEGLCPPDWKFQISSELEVGPNGGDYTVNLHLICDPCQEPKP